MAMPTQADIKKASQVIEAAHQAASSELVGIMNPVIDQLTTSIEALDAIADKYAIGGAGPDFAGTRAREFANQLRAFRDTATFLGNMFQAPAGDGSPENPTT